MSLNCSSQVWCLNILSNEKDERLILSQVIFIIIRSLMLQKKMGKQKSKNEIKKMGGRGRLLEDRWRHSFIIESKNPIPRKATGLAGTHHQYYQLGSCIDMFMQTVKHNRIFFDWCHLLFTLHACLHWTSHTCGHIPRSFILYMTLYLSILFHYFVFSPVLTITIDAPINTLLWAGGIRDWLQSPQIMSPCPCCRVYNTVKLRGCTLGRSFFLFLFLDIFHLKIFRQKEKFFPWSVIKRENKIACYWLLLISWWGVHTMCDTHTHTHPPILLPHLLSSPVSFSIFPFTHIGNEKKKMLNWQLGFLSSSRWRNLFSLFFLIVWYFSFLFGGLDLYSSSHPFFFILTFVSFYPVRSAPVT